MELWTPVAAHPFDRGQNAPQQLVGLAKDQAIATVTQRLLPLGNTPKALKALAAGTCSCWVRGSGKCMAFVYSFPSPFVSGMECLLKAFAHNENFKLFCFKLIEALKLELRPVDAYLIIAPGDDGW